MQKIAPRLLFITQEGVYDMNDSNAKTMYETVPAAAELNKVPGFDPLKFLRRTKDTLKLDLPYQKLWFRMAHPNGRMRLTALRITEQMAIFEAKVFLDRSDAEPFSMSTAQQTTQDSRDFVKAAQNEALSQALTDAGFGIQMISAGAQADLMEKSIETPVKKAAEPPAGPAARTAPPQEPHSAPQKGDTPAEGKSPARPIETPQGAFEAARTTTVTTAPPEENAVSETVEQHLPVEPEKKFDRLPVEVSPKAEQPAAEDEQADELPVHGNVTELPVQRMEKPEPAAEPMQPEDDAARAADTAVDTPSYTKDTPMEDILQVMTLEQAQQVIVDDGICKGMTIAQVAEKRPVNLRYYLIPGKSKNNMVRAAAQLVLNSLQKAG